MWRYLKSINNLRLFSSSSSKIMDNKRVKGNLKIGTHSGVFHCDEVLACFMLKQTSKYEDAEIIRSRDDSVLDKCDIVVDVGSVFDPKLNRFDHHQRSFAETLSSLLPEYGTNNNIKLSSAGLVYVFHGKDALQSILKKHKDHSLTDDVLDKVYFKVYKSFVEEMDGIDNGVPQFDGEPKYMIQTHLGSRVASLNPVWNEDLNPEQIYERFEEAMEMVGKELVSMVIRSALVWWPAREIVQKAIENRFEVDESGLILELSSFCPWSDHYFELESELNLVEPQPKYIIFADSANGFRVRAIPVNSSSFVLRKPLPKAFRGLRDVELVPISGIESIIFVHASGFIGGTKTREDALKLARYSLKVDE